MEGRRERKREEGRGGEVWRWGTFSCMPKIDAEKPNGIKKNASSVSFVTLSASLIALLLSINDSDASSDEAVRSVSASVRWTFSHSAPTSIGNPVLPLLPPLPPRLSLSLISR